MSKKGENIYKRKDGRWEGRYIRCYDENGKAKFGYIYGKTYTSVKQCLIQKKNTIPFPATSPLQSISYNELLDSWLQSSQINVKESSYARYHHLIETHIKPHLGKYPLPKIRTELIESFIFQQLTSGRLDNTGGLSPKTVNDMLTIIKSTVNYAKCRNLNMTCELSHLYIKRKDQEMRVLTKSEQDSLVKALLNQMDPLKFGVLLALYTGIRIGELCALQWEDFCFKRCVLHVRKTMQRIQDTSKASMSKTKIIITEPKSECSIRDIPLPIFICDYAKQFWTAPKAFVLSGDEHRYIEPRTMQNHFKRYVRESGIKHANFHALRHTFATRCVELEFELKSLSEILGHTNVNITLNRYVHSSFELKSANMNKLTLP